MTQASDPTLEFLERLKDESLWEIRRNIPIFEPHQRLDKDGAVLFEVTEADLPEIASAIRAMRDSQGVVPVITEGHRSPGLAEKDMPAELGFIPEVRVGTYGPDKRPAVLGDHYFRKDRWDRAREYRFRSAEYYPRSKRISGVALLKRDPMLNMGMVALSTNEPCYHYSLESYSMDTPGTPPAAPAAPAAPQAKPVLESDPVWQWVKQMHAKATAPPAAPAAPAAAPVAPAHASSEAEAIHYAKLEAEMAAIRADNERIRYDYAKEQAKHEVWKLTTIGGYKIPNPDAEIERLAKLDATQRQERINEIKTCYQRSPVGLPEVPVYSGHVEGGGPDDVKAAETHERAMEYMRAHPGMSYEAAEHHVSSK